MDCSVACARDVVILATEFTAVTELVNCYMAIHVTGERAEFISEYLETNIKVAHAAAKLFAEAHHIPYVSSLYELSEPLITIMKMKKNWIPAEFYPHEIIFLSIPSIDRSNDPQVASQMADAIAKSRGTTSFPSIGINYVKRLEDSRENFKEEILSAKL